MVQSRVVCALAGAALSALVLGGCAGGDPGVAQTPSPSVPASAAASASPSAEPTPTPSPASAAGPAVNIPVPEKPALADENSVEGLEAFTEWWFELGNYAVETGDVEPWQAKTDSGCKSCESLVESVKEAHQDNGWVVGGSVELDSFGSNFEPNVYGSISAFVEVTQGPATYYSADGSVLNETAGQEEATLREIIAVHENGVWLMLDFGSVNTGE
ncbi:MAG: DUF6318 family protein [Actinomycetes bacterium]